MCSDIRMDESFPAYAGFSVFSVPERTIFLNSQKFVEKILGGVGGVRGHDKVSPGVINSTDRESLKPHCFHALSLIMYSIIQMTADIVYMCEVLTPD